LLGLICIGLVGLGGAVYLYQSTFAEQAALPTPTVIVPVETATNTSTPSPTPTETPLPTPTGTRVIVVDGEQVPEATDELAATPTEGLALPTAEEEIEATATSTMVVETPTSESESPAEETTLTPAATSVPEMSGSGGILSASGGFLVWIGVAVLGVLLFGVWRQSRSTHIS